MKDFTISDRVVLSLSNECELPQNHNVVHRLVGVHNTDTGSIKIYNFYIAECIFNFLKTYGYWYQFVKSFINNKDESILYDANFPVENDKALPVIQLKCEVLHE